METWYSYSQIRFNREQIYWLLEHIDTLREGNWPTKPDDSELPDKSKLQVRTEASFAKPASIAAEIDWRLDQCGEDKDIFLLIYQKQIPIDFVAKRYSMDTEAIDKCCNKVLRYITGWRRKVEYREYNRHGR